MQKLNNIISWIKQLFKKKEVLPEFEVWYNKGYVPVKRRRVFKIKNGMMNGTQDWLEAQSGKLAYPYFDNDLECEDLYLVINLDDKEYSEYLRLVKHCGGNSYYYRYQD